MPSSFLEKYCFQWFEVLQFEWRCHAILILLELDHFRSPTVWVTLSCYPHPFGIGSLPVIYGSNVAIFICKQIFSGYLTSYKLSGSVMPSSSFGIGLLPVILFPTFCVLLLVIDFLQFEWHCHAILIFGKQIASSDLTSYKLSDTVMPSSFSGNSLLPVLQLPTVWVSLSYHPHFLERNSFGWFDFLEFEGHCHTLALSSPTSVQVAPSSPSGTVKPPLIPHFSFILIF